MSRRGRAVGVTALLVGLGATGTGVWIMTTGSSGYSVHSDATAAAGESLVQDAQQPAPPVAVTTTAPGDVTRSTSTSAPATTAVTSELTSTTSSTTEAPSTSVAPSPTTTLVVPDRINDPAQAAQLLYLAWKDDDRPDALRTATQQAVDDLFAHPWQPPDWDFTGCTFSNDAYQCGFEQNGVGYEMQVDGGASAGYQVQSVSGGTD